MFLADGVTAKGGIIVEGVAVGSYDVAETLEGAAKADFPQVAHHLYVSFLVQPEDDAAALLLHELLATTASDGAVLLWRALQPELTGDYPDRLLVHSGALRHLLIAEVAVFHLYKGACVAVATGRIVLSKSETACMAANSASRAADMRGYLMKIVRMEALLEDVVVLWSPNCSFCGRLEGCIHCVYVVGLCCCLFSLSVKGWSGE